MSHPVPPRAHIRRSEQHLADTPAVRRGSAWWLVSPTGALLASDPDFTGDLDRFAANMAAADQAVAELKAERKATRKDRP